jgi:hypothetical protein
LFLQCGIPESIQTYGDEISEIWQVPELPSKFHELAETELDKEVEIFRRREIHYIFLKSTAETNPVHFHALTYIFST